MTTYIAFLRGINVGGHTPLPMAELRAVCESIGLKNVGTYIQSGNVLFESKLIEGGLVKALEKALQTYTKKHIPVNIRSAEQLESVVSNNPFPDAKPSQVGVLFLTNPLPAGFLNEFTTSGPEELVVSERELYIHYPNGMGRSKLKLPAMANEGTVRNINTVSKLAVMSRQKQG